MALGAVQSVVGSGITPSYATPGSTEDITPSGGLVLHVKNANVASLTVTVTDAGTTPAGSAATNPTLTVGANTGDRMMYLNPALASPTTGLIHLAFSITSSVTAALLRVG